MPETGAVGEVQRLFLRHASGLRGFIAGLTPDFDAIEDILHETFLTATAKANEFAPGSDFPAWARAILHPIMLTVNRKNLDRRWPGIGETAKLLGL